VTAALVDDLAAWHAAGAPPIGTPHPDEPPSALWRCVLGAWRGTMERREAVLLEEDAETYDQPHRRSNRPHHQP